MSDTTKRKLRDVLEKWAYLCLGMAYYGPRSWAAVALILAVIALVLNESTPREVVK